jgi:hypothetical protein
MLKVSCRAVPCCAVLCCAVLAHRDLTITPRQRIQTYREITRLLALDNPTQQQTDRWGSCLQVVHCTANWGGQLSSLSLGWHPTRNLCLLPVCKDSVCLHVCLALCRLKDMQDKWQYDGDSTCAADGMCAVSCHPSATSWHPDSNLHVCA